MFGTAMLPPQFSASTPLPPTEDIPRLWDRYGMLDNIREHSRVVCAVALRLTDWLKEANVRLDRRAVEVGALLHDIAKTQCLGTSRRHDQEGEQLMRDLGYPELAYLVGVHVRLPNPHPIDESFIVYYADKRVKHDTIVGLPQRFAYIADRYGRDDAALLVLIEKGHKRAMAAERELFALLKPDQTPQSLEACVDASAR
jgi:uncharacterized protein